MPEAMWSIQGLHFEVVPGHTEGPWVISKRAVGMDISRLAPYGTAATRN
jgi:hypothetical protein